MKVSETEVRVIYGDTDAMGVVYYANYIKWFEVGRTEFLRRMGYPYKRMEEQDIWLPVAEVDCKYKSPARYDDLLVIRTWCSMLKASTVVMSYEIIKKETGEVCVTGSTKHAVTTPEMKPINFKKLNPELHDMIAGTLEK